MDGKTSEKENVQWAETSARNDYKQGKKSAPERTSYIGIREIARLSGVSTATVSRVINHPSQCRPETIKKVQTVIRKYKYIPNENIKNIFTKSSNTIAIFIQSISNPFYTRLIGQLNECLLKNRYTLMICDTGNDIEKEKTYRDFCFAKRCQGIIITEGVTNTLFDNIDIPIVWLDRHDTPDTSFVTSNNYESAREAVQYLYNLGHRNIAFVRTETNLQSVENRFRGYRDGLKALHIPFREELVFRYGTDLDVRLGKKAVKYFLLMQNKPTAVFCSNDMVALGVINEANRLGVKVPDNLSVCGFDHVLDDVSYIRLTTFEQNIPAIVDAMLKILIKYPERKTYTTIPTRFISGETCTNPHSNNQISGQSWPV